MDVLEKSVVAWTINKFAPFFNLTKVFSSSEVLLNQKHFQFFSALQAEKCPDSRPNFKKKKNQSSDIRAYLINTLNTIKNG
jgi:hypothetical protein